MKVCLACKKEISGFSWKCSQCDWEPALSNDIPLFAPHISGASEGYDPIWYEELTRLEENNFWFVARNNMIREAARKFVSNNARYLEVGCGTGFVLKMLCREFPKWDVCATEIQPEGIQYARSRVSRDITFFQMDACEIPFKSEFDVIGAFDVIEHVRDDMTAINQIYSALNPSGIFLVTVPQHMFLWSQYDEIGCHFRRYLVGELEKKLKNSGFKILKSTSFNSFLLPLMMLSRQLNKRKPVEQFDILSELKISSVLNYILSAVMKIEFRVIKLGASFPIGGSRLIVAQKSS